MRRNAERGAACPCGAPLAVPEGRSGNNVPKWCPACAARRQKEQEKAAKDRRRAKLHPESPRNRGDVGLCACGASFPLPALGEAPVRCRACALALERKLERARRAQGREREDVWAVQLQEAQDRVAARNAALGKFQQMAQVRTCACGAPFASFGSASRRCADCVAQAKRDKSARFDHKTHGEPERVRALCPSCHLPFRPRKGSPGAVCSICALQSTTATGPDLARLRKAARSLRESRLLTASPPPPEGSCLVCGEPCPGWFCSEEHKRLGSKLRVAEMEDRADQGEAFVSSYEPERVFDAEAGGASGKGVYRPYRSNRRGWRRGPKRRRPRA